MTLMNGGVKLVLRQLGHGRSLMVFIIITLTYICGLDGFVHMRILASVARPIWMRMVLSQLH